MSSSLVDLGVVEDPGKLVQALLRQIGTDLASVCGWDFHAGPKILGGLWFDSFYTHIPGCHLLCADSGWLFKNHRPLLEVQFQHDQNWGREAVIRDRVAAAVAKRRLAEFAEVHGLKIAVSERYDLPTYGRGYD